MLERVQYSARVIQFLRSSRRHTAVGGGSAAPREIVCTSSSGVTMGRGRIGGFTTRGDQLRAPSSDNVASKSVADIAGDL